MTINERFFDLLSKSGATYKQFSLSTGIPEKTINTWKYRGTTPPTEHIPAICKFFSVTYSYFLTGYEDDDNDDDWSDPEEDAAVEDNLSTVFGKILESAKNLDVKGRSLLCNTMISFRLIISSLYKDQKVVSNILFLIKSAISIIVMFESSCKTKRDSKSTDAQIAANIQERTDEFRDALFHYIDDMNK